MTSNIERRVMAGVGVIYSARQLIGVTAIKLYICIACLWGLGQLVWVAKVLENIPQGSFSGLIQFTFSAVLNTTSLVQLVLVVCILAFVSFFFDVIRAAPTSRFA